MCAFYVASCDLSGYRILDKAENHLDSQPFFSFPYITHNSFSGHCFFRNADGLTYIYSTADLSQQLSSPIKFPGIPEYGMSI